MGTDKALVEVDGAPMVVRAAAALRDAGIGPCIAIGGDARALRELGLAVEPDRWPGAGPLAGVATAVGCRSLAEVEIVVVVACDQPWLDPSVLRRLVVAAAGDPDAIGAAPRRSDGRLELLPAAWRRALGTRLRNAVDDGARRLDTLLDLGHVVGVPVDDERSLADVDHPGDLYDR